MMMTTTMNCIYIYIYIYLVYEIVCVKKQLRIQLILKFFVSLEFVFDIIIITNLVNKELCFIKKE